MPEPPREMYEELEHTADWALRVQGRDLPALFVNAALGMMELAGVRTGDEPGEVRRIELQALDKESLLVDWLHELLVALELEQLAFREIELQITGGKKLVGTFQAVPIISMDKPVKAVTYNELLIQESPDGLEATVVFDV
ncbi:MAG: archease [Chloroflexi bacterium]|nr:archease [Chloroflexota bacterium]MDK1044992.1 archease [Anaerolineales bacterium]MCH8340615.1 archease [Chloroflexota bacterium]MCI0773304.1 archease [Chloroflexota bacterium]MCI0806172.1 archease [Chloroflexota bacterium]